MRVVGMVTGATVFLGLQLLVVPALRAEGTVPRSGRTQVEQFVDAHQDLISEQVLKVGSVAAKDMSGGQKFVSGFFFGKETKKDSPLLIAGSIVASPGNPAAGKVYSIRLFRAQSRIGRRDQSFARQAGSRESLNISGSAPETRTLAAGANYLDLDEGQRVLEIIATMQELLKSAPREKGETNTFGYRSRGGVLFALCGDGKNKIAVVDVGTRQDPRPIYLTSGGLQKTADLLRQAITVLQAHGAPPMIAGKVDTRSFPYSALIRFKNGNSLAATVLEFKDCAYTIATDTGHLNVHQDRIESITEQTK